MNRSFRLLLTWVLLLSLLEGASVSMAQEEMPPGMSGLKILPSPESSELVPEAPAQSEPVQAETPEGEVLSQETVPPQEVVMPEDVPLKADQAILEYLMARGYFNAFPENRFSPETSMNRAEFVTLLYRAAGISTPYVSEFAYFRDVPTNHWAYIAVEGLRVRDVLDGYASGYFQPDHLISRRDAGILISKSLSPNWLKLAPGEVEDTLSAYRDTSRDAIPGWARMDLARSVYAGLLQPRSNPEDPTHFTLALEAPLTRLEAARMIFQRAMIETEEERPRFHHAEMLPPGLELKISPTSAISPEQLYVGHTLFFTVMESVPMPTLNEALPRGTRLSGRVTEISGDHLTAVVALERASLPSGAIYHLNSQVVLTFPAGKDDSRFIVPGQSFPINTRPAP